MASPDYGLLFANQPPPQIHSGAQAVLGGMQAGSGIALQGAQAKNMQLNNELTQMQAVNNLAAGVAFAPPEQQGQVYAASLKQANAAGLNTKGLPPEWGPEAQSAVQSAYYTSGMALQRMKAQVEMGMLGSTIGYRNSEIAKNNYDQGFQGQNVPLIGQGSIPSLGMPGVPQSGGMPQGGNGLLPQGGSSGMPGANPQQQQSGQVPGGSPFGAPQISDRAEQAKQEAQGKNWADFTSGLAKADENYLATKQVLNQLQPYIDKNKNTNPITGNLVAKLGLDPDYQNMKLLGDRINLNYISSFAKTVGRMDLPLVNAGRFLAPGPDKFQSSNQLEKNINVLGNELNHGLAQAAPIFDAAGIRSDDKALQIYSNAVQKTGAIDPKTGAIDMNKFNTWPQNLPEGLKNAFYQQNPDMYKPAMTDEFKMPNGQTGTYSQVIDAAKASKMTPEEYIKASNLQFENHYAIGNKLAQAVAPQESGGNYQATGPAQKNGDIALGKYQVMASNVRPWTKEVLGKEMTPQEFLSNPKAQDIVASTKLGQYYKKFKNPQDAFSSWFSGRPTQGNNSRDSLGTSVPQYVNSAMSTLTQMVQ